MYTYIVHSCTDTYTHACTSTHTHTHTHTHDLSTSLYVSSIERLHMMSLSINSPLLCGKYKKKCAIFRCTTKLKLQTDCCDCYGVLLLCLQLYHHGFQNQSQKHARFLEIKFYRFSTKCFNYWVNILISTTVSSNCIKLSHMAPASIKHPLMSDKCTCNCNHTDLIVILLLLAR